METRGSLITARRRDHVITRNSSFFKLFVPEEAESQAKAEVDVPGEMPSAAPPEGETCQSDVNAHREMPGVAPPEGETDQDGTSKRGRGRPRNEARVPMPREPGAVIMEPLRRSERTSKPVDRYVAKL